MEQYNALKQKSAFKVLCCRLSPDFKEIVVDQELTLKYGAEWTEQQQWEDFTARLPPDEGRYIVWDACVPTQRGVDKNVLQFIYWCPDNCSIKQRMLYASSKDNLKKQLVGLISADMQANETADLDFSCLMDHMKTK